MSRLSVVTWNAEGMFVEGTKTRRGTPHTALNVLRELDADIVVIPEFGRIDDLRDEIQATIGALGYELASYRYQEERAPGLGFVMLSRLPIKSQRQHDTGEGRYVLDVACSDNEGKLVRVMGVHLDDRSESSRLQQIRIVADIVNEEPNEPTLLLGDFNAMAARSSFARIARSRLARHMAARVRHTLMRSMATRVQEMALGDTIEYIQANTQLHDLDPGRQHTVSGKQSGLEWFPSLRLAKIDWIFGSRHFQTIHYRVMRDIGSDHRPIRAELEY